MKNNTTREQLKQKTDFINFIFGTRIEVVGQNGYYTIYDTADGHHRIGTGKTKELTYELLSVFEQGMRMIQNRNL